MNIFVQFITLGFLFGLLYYVDGFKMHCDADKFLVKDRLREGKKRYPEFNHPFVCQVVDALESPSGSEYSQCVKKIMRENDITAEKGTRFSKKTRIAIFKKLEGNKPLVLSLYECRKLLDDCIDVANLKVLFSWYAPL